MESFGLVFYKYIQGDGVSFPLSYRNRLAVYESAIFFCLVFGVSACQFGEENPTYVIAPTVKSDRAAWAKASCDSKPPRPLTAAPVPGLFKKMVQSRQNHHDHHESARGSRGGTWTDKAGKGARPVHGGHLRGRSLEVPRYAGRRAAKATHGDAFGPATTAEGD